MSGKVGKWRGVGWGPESGINDAANTGVVLADLGPNGTFFWRFNRGQQPEPVRIRLWLKETARLDGRVAQLVVIEGRFFLRTH